MANSDKNIWNSVVKWAAIYGAFITLTGGLFTVFKPLIDDYIISTYSAHEEATKDPNKKYFSQRLSEEINVPKEKVHEVVADLYWSHLKLKSTLDSVKPLLREELHTIQPKLIVYLSGRVKWLHINGELYDASIGPDGFYWFYLNNEWRPCKF